MLLYAMYDWLRKTRRGRLEAQRKRACIVVLTLISLIFLESARHVAAVDSALGLAEAGSRETRATLPLMLRPTYAPAP